MVMEQFINVTDKELMPLLREQRFKTLKKAATWADDHVLAHRPEPRAGGGSKGRRITRARGRWQCHFWFFTFLSPQLWLWQ